VTEAAPELSPQKLRILVAEDDFAITLALKTIVQNNFDCELVITHNGEEAWQAVLKQDFDLIISDWNMPIKTGCELLKEVRNHEPAKQVPFVMLTARADKNSVIDAVQAGVTDYIHKPFDRAALIKKINDVMQQPAEDMQQEATPPKKRKIVDEIVERLKTDSFDLPVISDIAERVTKMVTEDDATVAEVAEILKNDPIVTARLVALSNSSIYRGSKKHTTLEDAVTRVGLKETINYVWLFANAGLFESDDKNFADILARLRQHSMATAECARTVARHLKMRNADELFYMGLMHDIGAVLILVILKEVAKQEPVTDTGAIDQAIRQLHNQFGAVLLKRWKMSKAVQHVAQYHDDLDTAPEVDDTLLIIHFANRFTHHMGYRPRHSDGEEMDVTQLESAQKLNLESEFIEELSESLRDYMKEIDKMLQSA
jgi:HD-like signal output (HDOD) protein/CheY-like chemotaxis protein